MTKFKIGDKVKVIDNESTYCGTISKIKRIDNRLGNLLYILEKELPVGFWERGIKLVEKKPFKFEDMIL